MGVVPNMVESRQNTHVYHCISAYISIFLLRPTLHPRKIWDTEMSLSNVFALPLGTSPCWDVLFLQLYLFLIFKLYPDRSEEVDLLFPIFKL